MKKANKFEATWNGINDVVHSLKGAMNDITVATRLLKRGTNKIIEGLQEIDKQINGMTKERDDK